MPGDTAVAPPPPSPDAPASFETYRDRGLAALRGHRHQEAADFLERALALRPDQANLHHYVASAYESLGQHDRAAEHLHRVVCLRPEAAEAHNNWGIALARLGKTDDAIAAFAQALRLRPEFPEAHNNWGNVLAERGRLDDAVEQFRRALALHPAYPEANNNLGLTLARLGRREEAVAALREACRLSPTYAEAACNLGHLCRDLGRLEEALDCFRTASRLRPDHPDPRFQMGVTLARLGRLEEAIACLHQCLLFQPDSAETYHNLGLILAQRERFDEATAAFRQAVRLRPDSPDYLNNLGNTLLRQQKSEEAVSCFLRAVSARPEYPQAHCNLGSAYLEQGKVDEAIACYRESLRLRPDYVDAHFNLGNAHRKASRPDDALACYARALELQPGHLGARLNTGVTYTEQGRLDDAVAVFAEIQARKPDFAEAYNCMGIARLHQRRNRDALAQFDEGLKLKPEDPELRLNRALCLLLLGDYERGWPEYEWRWKLKRATPRPYPQPTWDGSELPQGTIVLWAEQGMGDILQFIRYAPLVKGRVGKVLLDCPGPLRGLLTSCPGVDALIGGGASHAPPDVQAPLLSLPRILGSTTATVPAAVPYLFVDAPLREQWRHRVGSAPGLRVGIVWQGNPLFSGDRYRSVPLDLFRPLAQVAGARLFSLQKGKGTEQLEAVAREWGVTDLGKLITGDYRDTAGALLSLDVVVAVDTSVAHLAGALGVPVWVLLPFNNDWRWLEDRDDSIWYPTARLFRQKRWGEWGEVLERVAAALAEQASRPRPRRTVLEIGVPDLVEQLVLRELRGEGAEAAWGALRETGLAGRAELARHMARLRAAHAGLVEARTRMRDAVAAEPAAAGADVAELLRRFVQAEQEREGSLKGLASWLDRGAPEDGEHVPTT
jgi:tetratricopeptide (TPR) repeat protein